MKYARMQHRLGMSAIAAVLALSATPLAAQEFPTRDTPVEATTAAEPVSPVVDPLAPVPEADAAAPAAGSTAAEETETTVEATTEEAATPAPITKKAATKTARAAPRAANRASTPVAATVPGAAPAAPVAAMEPALEAAPVEETVAQPSNKPNINETIPLAGGAGAVILALAGAGMAVRRKRRRDEEAVDGEWTDQEELTLTEEVEPVAEPAWDPPVHQPKAAPTPASMATTEVSDDFDTSRFGRHVQAAYVGPTPENPSLSLRKRLKLAGELDRRERLSGMARKPAMASKPVTASMALGQTVNSAKKPEYQY